MTRGVEMAAYYRNGKVQIQVRIPGKAKAKQRFAEDKEAGRIRRAIEDRKIQKEVLGQDLW